MFMAYLLTLNTNQNYFIMKRSEFIKTSGLVFGGLMILPNQSCSTNKNKHVFINSKSDYSIVIPSNPSEIETEASNQLKNYLSMISKQPPSIILESNYSGNNAIFLGETQYAKNNDVSSTKLFEDGYILENRGNNLLILGGTEKGLLYGVLSLLESFGFKKYSADDPIKLPETTEFDLPKSSVKIPAINYRTTNYYDARDEEYASWNKLSSRDSWGLFVHTYEVLVPPEKYGKTNPEYYSLIDGKRNPVTQLCLSNPDVLTLVVSELKKRIKENPKAKYWSVSQNDNDKHCQCGPCKALDVKYGNVPSGSVTWFTNEVAKQIPDKIISTLAYWYTRKAPKNIKIEPNVNIMLCNIESTREMPVFETDPAFTKDLQDWGKMSNDILIWDYNIQFANPISPFPNLHTIGPNIKFYIENNVNALFMQATGNKAEFGQLRSYLITQLMWNPQRDSDEIINEFLVGYYGGASNYVRNYIDTMKEALLETPFRLNIFGDPRDAISNYLSAENIEIYHKIFDDAESAVSNNSTFLKRVKEIRLPLMIAEIQIAGQIKPGEPGSFYDYTDSGNVIPKKSMRSNVLSFIDKAKKAGIARIGERAITIDDYSYNFERIFDRMDAMGSAISYKKTIKSLSSPEGGDKNLKRLTDGIFGAFESWRFPYKDSNWVAFKGSHMDIVLDLGEVFKINSIEIDFLNVQAQANWHQLILPKNVVYQTSIDGEKYGDPIKVVNPHNPDPAENPEITNVPFYSFNVILSSTNARYIKVHAESVLEMPSWHINAGKPAFIYVDEIVVK